jgi:TonB family protein
MILSRGIFLAVLIASALSGAKPVGQGDQEMHLTDFVLPSYPSLARASRVQGVVKVEIEVNSQCQMSASRILAGHPLLNSTVLEAIRDWHFSSCGTAGRTVDATFHFSLVEPDDPTPDDWAPTHFEMTGSYEFQIRTMAPDPIIYN